jgi:hypothetical protein
MSLRDRRRFITGAGLLAGFLVVLVFMFLPILGGRNALQYADALYNSISKASANFLPDLTKQVGAAQETQIEVALEVEEGDAAELALHLVQMAGATGELDGRRLRVSGPLPAILGSCLQDTEAMYHNDADQITGRYAADARQVMHTWWMICTGLDRGLKQQQRFAEAELITLVKQKGVEPAYNYFGVEPRQISESLGILVCSLVFYVIYTIWFGFAILYMFEGVGLGLAH